jgi:hypothetical protein
MRKARLAALALFTALSHCGTTASLRAVEQGRITDLSKIVDAEVKRGDFQDDDAIALARAIARNVVDHAEGPLGAARIHELQSCARHIDDALERRAEGGGPVAAAAVMVRLEAGLGSDAEDFIPWAKAAPGELSADFRAVGARALVTKDLGKLRRKLFSDGDQEVRRAALTAAARAADPADTEALLDAARLDPYPLARHQAIRAAGVIGGERIVLALKDVWALADNPAREAIASAWASPRSIAAGGRRELTWAMDTQRGAPAIAAAYALVRTGGDGAAAATAVLARVIETGVPRERIFAITVAPLSSPAVRAALLKASRDPEEEVAIAALARRLTFPPEQGGAPRTERPALIQKLLAVAKSDHKIPALLAKGELARAGAREVLPLLDRDAHGTDAQARKGAGMALVTLGELPRAAVVAADADPRVRVPVTCAILVAAPR